MADQSERAVMAFLDSLAYLTNYVDWRNLNEQIADHNGVIRVKRIGGGGDRDADYPTISLQSYAAYTPDAEHAAHDLDQQVWDRFLEVLNGDRSGHADGRCLDAPDKTSGPVELPSPDPTIRVVESIIRLTIRR